MANNGGNGRRPRWSQEEDQMLRGIVNEHGAENWARISDSMPNRNARAGRDRWRNQLDTIIKHGPMTDEEAHFIIREQQRLGNKWAQIAQHLPGRTEYSVKNFWNSSKRRQYQVNNPGVFVNPGSESGSGSDSDSVSGSRGLNGPTGLCEPIPAVPLRAVPPQEAPPMENEPAPVGETSGSMEPPAAAIGAELEALIRGVVRDEIRRHSEQSGGLRG